MDMTDVRARFLRGNRLLFTRESPCLQELLANMRQESRRTLVCWALTSAEQPVELLASCYTADNRPRDALRLSRLWAEGAVKMPLARQAILRVHAMAREVPDRAGEALCHAVGQACSAVHAEDHAIGLALYELTAIVREQGPDSCEAAVEARIAQYMLYLAQSRTATEAPGRPWAGFLLKADGPNREQRRYDRLSPTRR